jgi:hypothetical protein
MYLSEADALLWMERLLAAAVALQSLELLLVRRAFADDGVLRWATLRRDFAELPRPLRQTLDVLLSYRSFVLCVGLRLAAALALPWLEARLVLPCLLLTTLLVCVRFRGRYNGGSDSMTVVVLISLSLARLWPSRSLELAGLAYAATQLTLSYFVAGLCKLRERSWRSGEALSLLLAAPAYARAGARLSLSPRLAFVAAWIVMAFECAFPTAWLGGGPCLALLATALSFHLINGWLLGLNQFLWAWLAAYPALIFWTLRLSQLRAEQ